MKSLKKKISLIISIWLVVIMLSASVALAVLSYVIQFNQTKAHTKALLRHYVQDVTLDLDSEVNESIMYYIDEFMILNGINSAHIKNPDDLSEELYELSEDFGHEASIINNDGIIIASSNPDYIGYDMRSNEQSQEFLILLDDRSNEYIQADLSKAYNSDALMKYAGKRFLDDSGFMLLGINMEMYYDDIKTEGEYIATNRRIDETGYIIICDEDLNIIDSYRNAHKGKSILDAGIYIDPEKEYAFEDMECKVFGVPSYINITHNKGLYVIGVYSMAEVITKVSTSLWTAALLEFIVCTILFVALMLLLKKLIVDNMVAVNKSLNKITEGNLDERVNVRDSYEFDALSTDINATVDKLKGYIEEVQARIDEDLEIARQIQRAVLPSKFPPFPDCHDFEIYADMKAARVVGGDFYDFYMIGNDTLGFLVADVSGKSIPAAMFMMRGKATIRALTESGMPPSDVFTIANTKLCEGNDAELFITAWLGLLDLKTGTLRVANAGHNPPILLRNGKAEFISLKPDLVLAGWENRTYKESTMQLQRGDILFLYTDGVTEAMNCSNELYGEERLKELLSFDDNYPEPSLDNNIPKMLCEMVTADVERFVNGAEQSDDITMLCVRYI